MNDRKENIVSFTGIEKKCIMYQLPLYGKEWNWRNIKMEAHEQIIELRA